MESSLAHITDLPQYCPTLRVKYFYSFRELKKKKKKGKQDSRAVTGHHTWTTASSKAADKAEAY